MVSTRTAQALEFITESSMKIEHNFFLPIGSYTTSIREPLNFKDYIALKPTMKNIAAYIASYRLPVPFISILTVLFSSLLCMNAAVAETTDSTQALTDQHAQALFDSAMEERDSGKVYDSIQKFEYILSRRPSLNRARLELAVSYHRAKKFEEAMRELNAVLDDPETPEKVRLAILAYIGQLHSDQIKPKEEHRFSFYTKMGALHNDNVNFAAQRTITDANVSTGKKISSAGADTFFSASHLYRDNQPFDTDGATTLFEWQSQVSWTGNNYTKTNDFNLNILSASTGPAIFSTGRWRGAVNMQVDQIFYGTSDLGTFLSINPLVTFDLGNYQGISLEMSYTNDNFTRREDQDRDGHSVLAGAAFSSLYDDTNKGLEVGFRLTDHVADDNQFGYKAAQIYVGGFLTFNSSNNVYLNLSYKHYDYKKKDTLACSPAPCTTNKRNEEEGRYELGYNYDFSEGLLQDWTLNTSYAYVKNNSNVNFYNYKQNIFAINLARYFQ